MPPLQQLISFHIIEKNSNNKFLMRWTFPQISNENCLFLLQKLNSIDVIIPFLYFKCKSNWLYITNIDINNNEKIKSAFIVLHTTEFNPIKYEVIGKVFNKKYGKSGNPVDLVKLYLAIFTTGSCTIQENGSVFTQDFYNFQSNGCTNVKELINTFGVETILIYTCLLFKKRIAVYHHNLETLQKLIYTVTALMLHRNPNEYLYPYLNFSQDSLLEIKGRNWFLAGFTDINICSKQDLYDLLIHFPTAEILISPHAKDVLTMTKTQKDIALFLVQSADNKDKTEEQVVEEINNRTGELLTQLRSLATVRTTENTNMISMEILKSKKLNSAMENFLFNFAIAENIMLL